MHSLNDIQLESNKQIKTNFDGGDLSSDAGLLLLKEFFHKIGAVNLINRIFKTNDSARFRIHTDDQNPMNLQMSLLWRLLSKRMLLLHSRPCHASLTAWMMTP